MLGPASRLPAMADVSLHQSLSQQQTLAPQMRKSLEILQAGTLELSQIISQALEINPVLEDVTESVSLDEDAPDPDEADSLEHLNETDDDWRDRSILEGKTAPWTQDDEERRQHLYDSIVAPTDPAAAFAATTRPVDGRPRSARGGAGAF